MKKNVGFAIIGVALIAALYVGCNSVGTENKETTGDSTVVATDSTATPVTTDSTATTTVTK